MLTARAATAATTVRGSITVVAPPRLAISAGAGRVALDWPGGSSSSLLEETPALVAPAWTPSPDDVQMGPASLQIPIPPAASNEFYRLRLVE